MLICRRIAIITNYCIGITEINPFEFGLLPEQFFSYNLSVLPDIDLDFDEKGLTIAQEYLSEKYGNDHVAGIITFGKRGSKTAIKDSFRTHGLSANEASKLCRKIDNLLKEEFYVGSPRSHFLKFYSHYPNLPLKKWFDKATDEQLSAYDDASRIENTARAPGVHACGWLIGREPLSDYVPLTLHTDKETGISRVISQYDGHFAEDCGLLKLNLLSLYALKVSTLAEPESLNDKETMELFSRADTVGVFQFESEGMKDWLRQVKPESFEQLVALNTMYRPGAMERLQTFPDFWKDFVRTSKAASLFNKSHSVCYTLIAYRLAYLKVHEPALFYNTLYHNLKWEEDRKALHDDALQHGLVFIPESETFCSCCIISIIR